MEKSFTAIGSSVLLGAAAGGVFGLAEGIRQTANMTGKLRRTQMTNYIIKSGGSASNSLGSLAVIYSSFYALASFVREEDDEWKSVMTGGLTGALYKSSAGVRKCGMGGAFGLGLAAFWAFVVQRDERVSNYV